MVGHGAASPWLGWAAGPRIGLGLQEHPKATYPGLYLGGMLPGNLEERSFPAVAAEKYRE